MNKITFAHILALFISISLLAACAGTTGNSITPTPTTAMGALPPIEQSTLIPTQAPAVSSDNNQANVDVCAMVATTDVAAVLGSNPIAAQPGVDTDNETGLTINFCTYLGQGVAVVLSTTDPASVEAAKTYLVSELAQQQVDVPTTVTTEETGIGDQVFWSVAENGASYTVRVGSHVFSIGIGGAIGDPSSHKSALLELAKKIVSVY